MQQGKNTPRSHPHNELYQIFSNLSANWDPDPDRFVAHASSTTPSGDFVMEMSADEREKVIRFVCSYQFPTNIDVREQRFLKFARNYFTNTELFEVEGKQLSVLEELMLDNKLLVGKNAEEKSTNIDKYARNIFGTLLLTTGALNKLREDTEIDFKTLARMVYLSEGSA